MIQWICKTNRISFAQWSNATVETRKSMIHAYLTQGVK